MLEKNLWGVLDHCRKQHTITHIERATVSHSFWNLYLQVIHFLFTEIDTTIWFSMKYMSCGTKLVSDKPIYELLENIEPASSRNLYCWPNDPVFDPTLTFHNWFDSSLRHSEVQKTLFQSQIDLIHQPLHVVTLLPMQFSTLKWSHTVPVHGPGIDLRNWLGTGHGGCNYGRECRPETWEDLKIWNFRFWNLCVVSWRYSKQSSEKILCVSREYWLHQSISLGDSRFPRGLWRFHNSSWGRDSAIWRYQKKYKVM